MNEITPSHQNSVKQMVQVYEENIMPTPIELKDDNKPKDNKPKTEFCFKVGDILAEEDDYRYKFYKVKEETSEAFIMDRLLVNYKEVPLKDAIKPYFFQPDKVVVVTEVKDDVWYTFSELEMNLKRYCGYELYDPKKTYHMYIYYNVWLGTDC